MIGFKETDLGSIPNDWGFVRFEKVAELRHGHQFRSYDFTEDGIKIVKITQIKGNGNMDISSCSFVDINRIDEFQGDIIMKGDILIALTGATIGKIARCNSHEVLLQNYRVGNFFSKNEKKLCRNYLYQFLRSNYFFHQILARQTQSAQQNIGKDEINSMNLFLPSIEEQKAIAKVLTAFDDRIELLQAQNKTLETMAQTIFKEWFGKYQIGDELPEGWRVGKLGEIVTPLKGKNITKKQVITGKYPVIAGGLKPSVFHNVCNTKSPVLTVSASGANAGYVALHHNPVWSSDSTFIDISFTDSFYFIYVFLKNNQSLIFDKQEGSAIPHVYPRHLENLDIVIPNFIELEKYEKVAENFFNKISNNTSQILSLTKTRDTLLPKLMSGQVRVNHQKLQSS